MPEWTFVTNHGRVLSYIAQYPLTTTAREIAIEVGITERTAHKIITDLEAAGYITKTKVGRRNQYKINPRVLSRRSRDARDAAVADILDGLGWKVRKKRTKTAKPVGNETPR